MISIQFDFTVDRSRWKWIAMMGCLSFLSVNTHAQVPPATPELPVVSIVAPDPTALGGTSSGAFTLVRTGSVSDDLAIDIQFFGTASNGVDYVEIKSPVTIPAGFMAVDIPVVPILDPNKIQNLTVGLAIPTNSNYRVGEKRRATVSIVYDSFNLPLPTISIVDPTNESRFLSPATFPITAELGGFTSGIQGVSFYANDRTLGVVTNPPYSLIFTNARRGSYALFARVVDQLGRSTISAPVHVSVVELVPIVKISSPTNGATFSARTNITLVAEAAEEGGTIQTVSFFANSRPLGVVSNAPYSLIWSNVPAGVFSLQAVATDQAGKRGYSSPVFINVTGRIRNVLEGWGSHAN